MRDMLRCCTANPLQSGFGVGLCSCLDEKVPRDVETGDFSRAFELKDAEVRSLLLNSALETFRRIKPEENKNWRDNATPHKL